MYARKQALDAFRSKAGQILPAYELTGAALRFVYLLVFSIPTMARPDMTPYPVLKRWDPFNRSYLCALLLFHRHNHPFTPSADRQLHSAVLLLMARQAKLQSASIQQSRCFEFQASCSAASIATNSALLFVCIWPGRAP